MRYCGRIGYVATDETRPGIWEPVIIERRYFGDMVHNARKLESDGSPNDSPVLNNSISIVADQYAYEHYAGIRYAEIDGVFWKVTNIEIQRPRLLLTIGGLWNGKTAGT